MIVHVQFPDIRYLLQYPKDITKESTFRRYNELMYTFVIARDTECDVLISLNPSSSLESWDDLNNFLTSTSEFLFDAVKIGDRFWEGEGTSYHISDIGIVYNLPGINFPQIDNYVQQKQFNSFFGTSLSGALIGSAYDRCFFNNQQTITSREFETLLTTGN